MQQIRSSSKYYRLIFNLQKIIQGMMPYPHFATAIDSVDFFTNEFSIQRHKPKEKSPFINICTMRHFMEKESCKGINIEYVTAEEIENILQELMTKNKDKQTINIIKDCINKNKILSDSILKKMFRTYSVNGKVDIVEVLQKYTSELNPYLHKRNGEFLHYVAKAHCMKGNSENGLLILKQAYVRHEGLRSFYRVIFRELIYDSIQNRSEASLVIFMKYVLIFSEIYNDHYPLICFWHYCWSSTWFSDQMLSNELLESSTELRNIIKEKATTFSINILRDYNEDAVVRLLQTLLKYDMMVEYAKVLQILFTYKLKHRDIRGCTEIVKNCNTLGISLSSNQQGRFIKMLINSKHDEKSDSKPTSPPPNFKLKF